MLSCVLLLVLFINEVVSLPLELLQLKTESELQKAVLTREAARWAGISTVSASSSFDRASLRASESNMGEDRMFESLPNKYVGHLFPERSTHPGSSPRSPSMAVMTRQRSMAKATHAVDFVSRIECPRGQLPARSITFHPTLPLLITADLRDCVTTYDFTDATKPKQISRFSNKNLTRSMINSLTWIDTDVAPMVLIASDVFRVWRVVDGQGDRIDDGSKPASDC